MLACNIEYVTEETKNPYCTCKWIKHRREKDIEEQFWNIHWLVILVITYKLSKTLDRKTNKTGQGWFLFCLAYIAYELLQILW